MCAAQAKESATKTEEPTFTPFSSEAIMEMNSANIQTFTKMSDVMMKGVATLNEEMSRFASMRFSEDMEAQKSFMACKSPIEAFSVCSSFMQSTMREYFEEVRTLTGIAAEISQQSLTPVEEQTEEILKAANGATKKN
ncbi:phasin family protein [Denitrobaculum tricleocarpae]|uniref:Phasin family protein n=1 Tax=Denitrobaculum tricleocarpae TaxID=2591009 RepID=A0A545U1P7_9PROT|nr:phasin family protein [Denitrobaculum tricleocarpae]TQV83376.1 phasin family protein [Denitrobaculum tricleocarpae]